MRKNFSAGGTFVGRGPASRARGRRQVRQRHEGPHADSSGEPTLDKPWRLSPSKGEEAGTDTMVRRGFVVEAACVIHYRRRRREDTIPWAHLKVQRKFHSSPAIWQKAGRKKNSCFAGVQA